MVVSVWDNVRRIDPLCDEYREYSAYFAEVDGCS